MAEKTNFLLGVSDYFTQPLPPPKRKVEKKHAYSFERAKQRLVPQAEETAKALDALPRAACPHNEAVAVLTLHPEYLAKSFYPSSILREIGLETVGSRPVQVKPEARTLKRSPEEMPSTSLFVAGSRKAFDALPAMIGQLQETSRAGDDLPKLEELAPFTTKQKLRELPTKIDEPLLELVIHAGPRRRYVLEAFEAYAQSLDVSVDFDRRFDVGNLCFVPARGPRAVLDQLAQFSFLRVARLMPRLRPLETTRSATLHFPVALPAAGPTDPSLHVAVFDGGVPAGTSLAPWVQSFDAPGVDAPLPEYQSHGTQVSSALLFGPLTKGQQPERPYASIDHYRVLDRKSHEDEDLYDVLHRIETILLSNPYRFMSLSLGPDKLIDDDDVHAWTSVLDGLLADGETLATVAVGNGGERDATLGYNRLQVPADCVNAVAVGATDKRGTKWQRADYSCVGPGRSPGLVKPDCVSFGGSESEPFYVLDASATPRAVPQIGTSFAGPNALRLGVGVRAHFGDLLSPLAIRALLIHCTEESASVSRDEIGWGRLPASLEDLVVCSPSSARVVYQGELRAGQYVRARIPIPDQLIDGMVKLRATFCYACEVDPAHPGNYTRAGLDVWFRPHDEKLGDGGQPKTAPFFRLSEFSEEKDLRRDAHKWETVLHREKSMHGKSLRNPAFDVHYNARVEGHLASDAERLRYALVISLETPRMKDVYDRIVRRYPTQIRPLQPVVTVPVRTRGF